MLAEVVHLGLVIMDCCCFLLRGERWKCSRRWNYVLSVVGGALEVLAEVVHLGLVGEAADEDLPPMALLLYYYYYYYYHYYYYCYYIVILSFIIIISIIIIDVIIMIVYYCSYHY